MAQLLEFTYDGTTKVITASENCTLQYTLVGGGGGGGGPDRLNGSDGLPGLVVNGAIALTKGQTVYCSVGGAGTGGGAQGTSKAGGPGGYSLDGFSGGTGGTSGWAGSSGAGGGGGGATVLSFDTSQSNLISVAAGGGGGGGGGNHGYGATYSTSSYGDTQSYALRYYSDGSTNGSWSSLLNTYSIWNGNGDYTWEVYFPDTANYTFTISIDNTGAIYLDGTLVKETTGNEFGRFGSTHSATKNVTKGWHTVKMNATNWGGPAALGGTISDSSGVKIWTTRSSYNPLSATYNAGRGGHGVNYSGDGGGAGGGGGGYRGGRGGSTRGGDVGGYSGSTGYNYNAYPAITTIGSPSSYGAGGAANWRPGIGASGTGGYAAFTAVHTDTSIKQNGTWKKANAVYVRDSISIFGFRIGYWKSIESLYTRSNGEWKKVYGENTPAYYSLSNTYNNTSGPYPG